MKLFSIVALMVLLSGNAYADEILKDDTGSSARSIDKEVKKTVKENNNNGSGQNQSPIPPDFPLDPYSAICGCNPYFPTK